MRDELGNKLRDNKIHGAVKKRMVGKEECSKGVECQLGLLMLSNNRGHCCSTRKRSHCYW